MSTSIHSAEEEMTGYQRKVVRNDGGSTLKTYQHSSSSSLSSSSSTGGKSVRFEDYVDVYVVCDEETTQFGDRGREDDLRIYSGSAHFCHRFTGCRPSQGRCFCDRLRCPSSVVVGGGRSILKDVEHCPLGHPLVNICTDIGYDSDIETEDHDDDYNDDDDDHQIKQQFCIEDDTIPPLLESRWTEERRPGTVSISKRDVSMKIPQRR
mmetsp:Transcript_23723/g.56052  ORF Transcript_23723/g.56052 Transcript_23723/m.56052 type:complete len:208 (+) Transcript_23723:69-692(+)